MQCRWGVIMTMVVNVSSGTRHIAGKTLPPKGMADVERSYDELSKHLFVKCGDIEVSKPSSGGSSKGKQKSEPESTEE